MESNFVRRSGLQNLCVRVAQSDNRAGLAIRLGTGSCIVGAFVMISEYGHVIKTVSDYKESRRPFRVLPLFVWVFSRVCMLRVVFLLFNEAIKNSFEMEREDGWREALYFWSQAFRDAQNHR
jgi:hypothetical protein